MTMFRQFLANENTKNMRRSMLWIELAILVALFCLIQGLLYATLNLNLGQQTVSTQERAQMMQSITWPGSLVTALELVAGSALGGMLLVVMAAAVTAQEYNWRTFHLWLSRGVPRSSLLLAKFTALLLPAILIVSIGLLSVAAITALFTLQQTGSLPLGAIHYGQLFLSLVRTTYSLLPYTALAFLLAIATRSTVVSVAGGLIYPLVAEGLLVQLLNMAGGNFSRLTYYLPAGLSGSLTSLNQTLIKGTSAPTQTVSPSLAPLPAAAGIALWTVLLVGLAIWIFRRQDLAD
jgi:ABC-type transport system involved in multi-copper enzyme maturation permease subunit